MMQRMQEDMKRTNNIIGRVADRHYQMAETERWYIALKIVEKDFHRYKNSVNRLHTAKESRMGKKGDCSTDKI